MIPLVLILIAVATMVVGLILSIRRRHLASALVYSWAATMAAAACAVAIWSWESCLADRIHDLRSNSIYVSLER